MEVHIGDKKVVITIVPKIFYFDLLKDADKIFKYEIYFITKHNDFLTEHTIKNKISWWLCKYKHGNNTHEHRKQ